jgi:hypothetical protein
MQKLKYDVFRFQSQKFLWEKRKKGNI